MFQFEFRLIQIQIQIQIRIRIQIQILILILIRIRIQIQIGTRRVSTLRVQGSEFKAWGSVVVNPFCYPPERELGRAKA